MLTANMHVETVLTAPDHNGKPIVGSKRKTTRHSRH
jgi:hypothetical protein